MREKKHPFPLHLTQSTEELKRLIAEHPDYPLVVLAGEEANGGDYSWCYCSDISFSIGDVLEAETPYNDEIVCSDRDDFEENMQDWLCDKLYDEGVDVKNMPDAEFDKLLKAEIAKYDPYWKKVITIWAAN